jgi:hypothetical protein
MSEVSKRSPSLGNLQLRQNDPRHHHNWIDRRKELEHSHQQNLTKLATAHKA